MPDSIDLSTYKDLLFSEGVGIAVWNLETDEIVYYDEKWAEIFTSAIQVEHFSQVLLNRAFVHPNDRPLLVDMIAFLSRPHKEYRDSKYDMVLEHRIKDPSGNYQWYHIRQIVYFKGNRPYRVVAAVRNTDAELHRQEELQRQAECDPMTGLYNKGQVRKLIDETLRFPDTENALLVLDMDGFKQVNDQLGHLAGDAVISDMALSLQTVFRKTDIMGRIGGDEFVVLLRDTVGDRYFIVERCNELRKLLRRSFPLGNRVLHVTGSIGIAQAPKDGNTYETLFACADVALYKAKESGRDTQVFYEPSLKDCSTEKNENRAERLQKKELLEHPAEYIFRMLYETKDAQLTVKLLLELFAKYFHVHRVFIYRMFDENYWSQCIFEWRAVGIISSDESHTEQVMQVIYKNYGYNEYGYFSECNDAMELEPEVRDMMLKQQVRSFIHCGIMDGKRFMGCVGFDDAYQARIWTRKEHEVLKAFADIMGSFLLDQSRIEDLSARNRHFRLILDTLECYVWVIQQDTWNLLYMNAAAYHDFLKKLQVLEPCYQTFQDRSTVCPHCMLSSAEQSPVEFSCWNEKFQRKFKGKAFLTDWDEGTKSWIIFADK